MNIHNVEFIKSAAASRDIIKDRLPQVVFAGRSNVGKSSVINKLLNRGNFARVSSTPGKTIHINYFLIDKAVFFVDLPGYGYAKTAKSERSRWAKLLEAFFSDPKQIALGVLIVDVRHKPTGDDVLMSNWFKATGRPFVIAANKVDKVNNREKEENITLIRETVGVADDIPVIPFSAKKGIGRDSLLGAIENSIIK